MGQPRSPLPAGSGAGGSGGPAAQAQQRTAASSHLERTTTMGQSEEQSLRLLSLNCPVQRGGSHLANPPGQPGLGLRPTTTQPTRAGTGQQLRLQKGMGIGLVTPSQEHVGDAPAASQPSVHWARLPQLVHAAAYRVAPSLGQAAVAWAAVTPDSPTVLERAALGAGAPVSRPPPRVWNSRRIPRVLASAPLVSRTGAQHADPGADQLGGHSGRGTPGCRPRLRGEPCLAVGVRGQAQAGLTASALPASRHRTRVARRGLWT